MIGKRLIIGLLLLSFCLALRINVDPPRIKVNLAPGETIKRTISIANKGQEAVTVRAYLSDFYMRDQEKQFISAGSTVYTMKESVRFFPASFVLKPNESKHVLLNISAAKSDISGEYGVLFFEAHPMVSGKSSRVSLGGRIGTILQKEIKDLSLRKYEFSDLKAGRVKDKLFLRFVLKNQGNILLEPEMTLLLVDVYNRIHLKKTIKPFMVLPDQEGVFNESFIIDSDLGRAEGLSVLLTFQFAEDDILVKELSLQ